MALEPEDCWRDAVVVACYSLCYRRVYSGIIKFATLVSSSRSPVSKFSKFKLGAQNYAEASVFKQTEIQ